MQLEAVRAATTERTLRHIGVMSTKGFNTFGFGKGRNLVIERAIGSRDNDSVAKVRAPYAVQHPAEQWPAA